MFIYVTFLIVLFNIEFNNGLQTKNYKRICYYTNWSQYRPGEGKFVPENIDPFLCTHIVYAYAKLDGNRITHVEWNDEDSAWSSGMYTRLNNLKLKNPSLKTLLGIGGWSQKRKPISKMAALMDNRQEFANTSVVYLRSRGFDGLTIDWQYPEGFNDKKNLPLLLKEIRRAFDQDAKVSGLPALLLAIGAPGGEERIKHGYDVQAIDRYLDIINLMSYDFHGSWETVTGHHSSLYPGPEEVWYAAQLNVDWAANKWIGEGASKEKLIIGIPMYGRGYSLEYRFHSGIGASANGGSSPGEFLKTTGTLAFYEICRLLKTGAKVTWLSERRVPYLIHGKDWVGYDNQRSVSEKVKYVMDKALGGVMIMSLDQDDFGGTFCSNSVRYPLLTAINMTLNGEFVITTPDTITTTITTSPSSASTLSATTSVPEIQNIAESNKIQLTKVKEPTMSPKVKTTNQVTEVSSKIIEATHATLDFISTTKTSSTQSPKLQNKNTRIITPPDTTFFPEVDLVSSTIKSVITTTESSKIQLNDNAAEINILQTDQKNAMANKLSTLNNRTNKEKESKGTAFEMNVLQSDMNVTTSLDSMKTENNDSMNVVKLSKYISSIGKKQTTEKPTFEVIDLNENYATNSNFSRRKLLQADPQQTQNDGQQSSSRDAMGGFGNVLNSLFSVISEFSGGIRPRSTPPRRRNDSPRRRNDAVRQRQFRQNSRENSATGISSTSPFDQQPETLSRDIQRRREPGASSVTPVPGRRNIRNRRPLSDRNNNQPSSQRINRLRGNLRRRRPNRNRLNPNRNGNQGASNPNDVNQDPATDRINRRRNMRNRALQQSRRNGNGGRNNVGLGRNSIAQRSMARNGLTRGQIRDSFFTRVRESEPSLLQEPLLTSMDIPSLERLLGMSATTSPSETNAQQNDLARRGNNARSLSQQRRRILSRLPSAFNRPFRRSTIIPRRNQFRQITNLNSRNGNTNSSLMIIPLENLDQSLQQVVSAGPGERIRNQTTMLRRNFQRAVMANPPTPIMRNVPSRRVSLIQGSVSNSGLSSNVALNNQQTQLVRPRGPVVPARSPIDERKEPVPALVRSRPDIINIVELTPSPPLGPVLPTPRTVIQPIIQIQRQPPLASSSFGLNAAQKIIPPGPIVQELPPRLIKVERPRQQNVIKTAIPTRAPVVASRVLPTQVPIVPRRLLPQRNMLNLNVDPTIASSAFIQNSRLPTGQIPQTLVIQINPLPAGSNSLATGTIMNGNRQGQAVDIVNRLKPPGLLNINVPVPKEEALQTPLDVIQQSESSSNNLLPQQTRKPPIKQQMPKVVSNESQLNSMPKSEVLWKWEV